VQTINIILPDGKNLPIPEQSTVLNVAQAIGAGLARAALAGKINGQAVDLSTAVKDGDKIEILTFASAEGKQIYWHSTSHLLAMAVKDLFPEAKLSIGPAIDQGFYYDFDMPRPFTPDDLPRIENKMQELSKAAIPFVRKELSRDEAVRYFSEKEEIYKVELVQEAEGNISIYNNSQFTDLCRGPHVPDTSVIKSFKLQSIAGAYWRGSEKNKMLQRVYGISYPNKKDLDEYLSLITEAEKRDHRRIGKDLDLFSFNPEGPGFPFWHSKGMILYNTVIDFMRSKLAEADYGEVKTPIILNEELWHRSGHWDKYRENMYFTTIDKEAYAVKPMNCPGGLLIYKSRQYSYRDLPLRMAEFGLVHRHEKAGVLHGLFRVRQFTQDDAHVFCTPDQIETEINSVIDMVLSVYQAFGFKDYHIELSTKPEKHIGSDDVWEKAENALQSVLDKRGTKYKVNPGDGAFYGPKIDFHIQDCLKRSWQCGTIQLDFSMPERFELEYIAQDGARNRPVMIHRAIMGSIERFIGIAIEHFGGAFPLWLAPVQVAILPISEKFNEYGEKIKRQLRTAGIRCTVDARNEKIGARIRDAEIQKIPYMAVVGQKEQENQSVAVRQRHKGDQGAVAADAWIKVLLEEITQRVIF
jgi:threonyl-tRNA synthetase